MIYLTADEHYDHYTTSTRNIIKYANRPFSSINEMNQTIIRNFNSMVKNEDETWHIGDFTLKGVGYKHWFETMLKQLNGTHHLVLGNHDRLHPWDYVEVGFTTVHTAVMLEEFILVHDPVAAITRRDRIFLCGHVHDLYKTLPGKNIINVGVDVWQFQPISIAYLRECIPEWLKDGTLKLSA
jgi:calcineurin-like phosphoesterase family protein